jgi:hypothetical protein
MASGRASPNAAAVLEDAAEDILAYQHLPLEHQRQLHNTNPLEHLNKEIRCRSNVVGIFPNPAQSLEEIAWLITVLQPATPLRMGFIVTAGHPRGCEERQDGNGSRCPPRLAESRTSILRLYG